MKWWSALWAALPYILYNIKWRINFKLNYNILRTSEYPTCSPFSRNKLKLIIWPWCLQFSNIVSWYNIATGRPLEWCNVKRFLYTYWVKQKACFDILSNVKFSLFMVSKPCFRDKILRNGNVPSSNLKNYKMFNKNIDHFKWFAD